MKTKCVTYSRVSTDLQSTKSQLSDLKRYAINNDFIVVKDFEESVSGFITERDALEALKVFIKVHNIKNILCYEISRLGRYTLQKLEEIDYFSKEGVNIYLKKENLNTLSNLAQDKLLLNLLSSISELEVSTLKSRIARGHRESASQGKRTGLMTLPYGYKADDKSFLIIDEEEAKVIREIYSLALQGKGYRRIASELNSKGILTRWTKLGRINKNIHGVIIPIKWKPNSIGVILNNTLYKGKRKYKDEFFDVPPIIDELEWNKVHEVISKKPGVNNKPTKYNYLLKGKVVCGVCGRHYGSRTETRYGKEDSFYYCNGARDIEIRCKNGQYSANTLEKSIYYLLFFHKDLLMKLKEEEYLSFNLEEKMKQIKYYANEIINNNAQQERLVELRLKGHIDEKRYNKEHALILGQNEGYKIKIKNIKNEIEDYNNSKSNILKFRGDYWLTQNHQPFIDKYLNKVIIYKIINIKIPKNQISKQVKAIYDDPNYEAFPRFEKLINSKKHMYFAEIFAFNNTKPLKAVIVNGKFDLFTVFVTPTLQINDRTLSIEKEKV